MLMSLIIYDLHFIADELYEELEELLDRRPVGCLRG